MHHISANQLYQLRAHTRPHYLGFALKKSTPFHITTRTLSNRKGDGAEFYEYRPYQHGDAPRMIDWRITARTNTPWVKQCHAENGHTLFFWLDLTSGIFFTSQTLCKSVITLQLFALLGWQAVEQGSSVSGIILNENGCHFLPRGKGEKHFSQLLRYIASIHHSSQLLNKKASKDPAYLGKSIHTLVKHADANSNILLISDFISLNTCALTHLCVAAAKYNISAIRVSDPMESGQCSQGVFPVSDGTQTAILPCDKQVLHSFMQFSNQQFAVVKSQLEAQQINLWDINTCHDAAHQLQAMFKGIHYG